MLFSRGKLKAPVPEVPFSSRDDAVVPIKFNAILENVVEEHPLSPRPRTSCTPLLMPPYVCRKVKSPFSWVLGAAQMGELPGAVL